MHHRNDHREVWVQANGDAGPALLRLYFCINIITLSVGACMWVRTLVLWRHCYRKVNVVVQTYAWITAAHTVNLTNLLVLCFYGAVAAHLPDTAWCSLNAFISMLMCYGMCSNYLSSAIVALYFGLGNQDTPSGRYMGGILSGSGWILGFAMCVVYAATDSYGPYRNLYCMVPHTNFKGWVLFVGFIYAILVTIGVIAVQLLGWYLSIRVYNSHDVAAEPLSKALSIIQAANLRLLAIYCVCQGSVLLTEGLVFAGVRVPVVVDTMAAMLFKSQPMLDGFLISNLLSRIVNRKVEPSGITDPGPAPAFKPKLPGVLKMAKVEQPKSPAVAQVANAEQVKKMEMMKKALLQQQHQHEQEQQKQMPLESSETNSSMAYYVQRADGHISMIHESRGTSASMISEQLRAEEMEAGNRVQYGFYRG